jgi:hypothetical protein
MSGRAGQRVALPHFLSAIHKSPVEGDALA